jgi:iron complex outermembrane receptor protein
LASCGSGSELKQVIFQQRDATFYGVELAGEYDVARVWRGLWGVSAQYDFVHAEFSDGENVPRIPPHRLGGGVYYRDANWAAGVNLLHAFDQNEIGFGETPTAGYTLLGATVSYTANSGSRDMSRPEFTIGLKGDNLLNDDVRNAVSFKKDEVLEPGASVRLFGSIKLN